MKNNRGFSFVEIIVVIAILAVISTGVIFAINNVGRAKSTECAKKIDAELKSVRLDNMSKDSSYYLVIYKDGGAGDYYMKVSTDPTGDLAADKGNKIGSSDISISYTTASSTVDINGVNKLVISYDKGTGKFKFPGDDISSVSISGSGKQYKITFSKETGKHTLK